MIYKILKLIISTYILIACSSANGVNVDHDNYIKSTKEIIEKSICNNDSQCIVVENYCSCRMGGGRSAIHIKLKDQWEEIKSDFSKKGFDCLAVISKDWSCKDTIVSKCVANKCTLKHDEKK